MTSLNETGSYLDFCCLVLEGGVYVFYFSFVSPFFVWSQFVVCLGFLVVVLRK